jgi:hypothetical protein
MVSKGWMRVSRQASETELLRTPNRGDFLQKGASN